VSAVSRRKALWGGEQSDGPAESQPKRTGRCERAPRFQVDIVDGVIVGIGRAAVEPARGRAIAALVGSASLSIRVNGTTPGAPPPHTHNRQADLRDKMLGQGSYFPAGDLTRSGTKGEKGQQREGRASWRKPTSSTLQMYWSLALTVTPPCMPMTAA
jgi:hypothetical protein